LDEVNANRPASQQISFLLSVFGSKRSCLNIANCFLQTPRGVR
jgi:hypothetical protein